MECTTENLNVLSNMKKKDLIDLVFHFCMRIAEEKFLIKDKEILINSHNIFYKCLRQHNKETIRYMIFRKCILKTVTKHLLTRNKIIKKCTFSTTYE